MHKMRARASLEQKIDDTTLNVLYIFNKRLFRYTNLPKQGHSFGQAKWAQAQETLQQRGTPSI